MKTTRHSWWGYSRQSAVYEKREPHSCLKSPPLHDESGAQDEGSIDFAVLDEYVDAVQPITTNVERMWESIHRRWFFFFQVRICSLCQSGERFTENQLHCKAIWLHALRYKVRTGPHILHCELQFTQCHQGSGRTFFFETKIQIIHPPATAAPLLLSKCFNYLPCVFGQGPDWTFETNTPSWAI